MPRSSWIFLFIFILSSLNLSGEIKIYYYYDPVADGYIFTNTCHDLRICKPLYVEKGEVRHSNSYRLKPGDEKAFDSIIMSASKKYGVDFHLIKSVIKAESLFDKNAVSTAGAGGLMQLMPETARELGVSNVYDPEQNIMGGTKYLKRMINKFKNHKKALAAYNAGPAAVLYYGGIPPYNETKNYVSKICGFYTKYTGKKL